MDLEASPKKYHDHDTHAFPPQAICNTYKYYQKIDDLSIDKDLSIVDFGRGLTSLQQESITSVDTISSELIAQARDEFMSHWPSFNSMPRDPAPKACTVYEHKDFPGLRILPSLLPPECQFLMLDAVLHRDLSNPLHKTNIHQDYNIPYPPPSSPSPQNSSFFTYPPHSKNQTFTPINPLTSLKPVNTTQFLHKKLRWLTLGSQYDWSTRSYPSSSPTPFPGDIKELVEGIFGGLFKAESGVVLLYGAKDYMPVHRDVSEECQRGLASFTVGCDGLFVISKEKGPSTTNDHGVEGEVDRDAEQEENTWVEDGKVGEDDGIEMEMCVLRVRSGDCVWMGGETRWCWHAMPKIISGTCPEWLAEWPVGPNGDMERKEYEKWRGFMKGKRLNISCRQVWN